MGWSRDENAVLSDRRKTVGKLGFEGVRDNRARGWGSAPGPPVREWAIVLPMRLLAATRDEVLLVDADPSAGRSRAPRAGRGIRARPTCLAVEPSGGRAWCGTVDGMLASDDGGATWRRAGLEGEEITAVTASPAEPGVTWAGTEPSAVYRSEDAGETWTRAEGLLDLPSSSTWSFPPKPETHHVRWIAGRPDEPGRLWVAIEAGALVATTDGGATWRDRVEGGPFDTHEIAIHPDRPRTLRVAAGDGYYESDDGGSSWRSPHDGLEVGYLRSVAVDPGDPDVVVVSAASRARSAYQAGASDGRVYRRERDDPWRRVTRGWPDPPETIAPLLVAGREPGEIYAADERGVHRSADGGETWERVAAFETTPAWLRGLAVVDS